MHQGLKLNRLRNIGQNNRRRTLCLPNTPLWCHSVFRYAPWTGKCFNIIRASDSATMDIGFTAQDVADFGLADRFAAGTTWNVKIWYDQSGNGYDLTAPTTGARPLNMGNTVNGIRAITFTGPQGTTQTLSNTSVPITNIRNCTIMSIMKPVFSQYSAVFHEMGNPTAVQTHYTLTGYGTAYYGNDSMVVPNINIIVNNGSSNRTYTQNGIVGTASANASSAVTGITLGNGLGYSSYPGALDILSFVGYNSTLSSADQASLTNAASAASGINPSVKDVFVLAGDSITAGTRVTSTSVETTYAAIVKSSIGRPFTWYNMGYPGTTASAAASSAAQLAANCYSSGHNNYVSIFYGTNDLAANTSAATTYTSIKSIVSAYNTAGFTKIAVSTILPRSGSLSGGQTAAGFETARLALNALIRAGVGVDGFGYLVDPGGDPVIGVASTYLTSTYSFDNVHPTALGYSILAADFVNGILPML